MVSTQTSEYGVVDERGRAYSSLYLAPLTSTKDSVTSTGSGTDAPSRLLPSYPIAWAGQDGVLHVFTTGEQLGTGFPEDSYSNGYITDKSGNVWELVVVSQKPFVALNPVTINGGTTQLKVDFRIANGGPLLTDEKGTLWFLDDTTATTVITSENPNPNQATSYPAFSSRAQPGGFFITRPDGTIAYQNGSGSTPLTVSSVTGLQPGHIYGGTSIAITDNQGIVHTLEWVAYNSAGVVDGKGRIIERRIPGAVGIPGTSSTYYGGAVFLTDTNGDLWYGASESAFRKLGDAKFKPGLMVTTSNGNAQSLLAASTDGTVYEITISASATSIGGVRMTPTGIYLGDKKSDATDDNKCVAQMPTTGAPTGNTDTLILVFGVLLAGVAFAMIRRQAV